MRRGDVNALTAFMIFLVIIWLIFRTHLKNGFAGEHERISPQNLRRRDDSYWKYDESREGGFAEIRRLQPKCIFEMGSR